MWNRLALIAMCILPLTIFPADAIAKTQRSAAQVATFKRHHTCPSTGKRSGSCPGYVVDHIEPLCAGGPDNPGNMQWQTVAEAKAKDREERKKCRHIF